MARVLADGTPLILYVAQAGESFAEASLSAAHYHCDAIAETDAAVLALPKADLLSALAADPAECLALALTLAAQVRELARVHRAASAGHTFRNRNLHHSEPDLASAMPAVYAGA